METVKAHFIEKIKKVLSEKIAKEIEAGIIKFSKEYAETNNTPFLLDCIYETKCNEIISQILNKNSSFLIKNLKNGTIEASKIAFMKPEELDPNKFESIIKNKELSEYKKNNKKGSNIFTCSKCKKANCDVTMKQVRPGDEPPATFVTCLECGYKYSFEEE